MAPGTGRPGGSGPQTAGSAISMVVTYLHCHESLREASMSSPSGETPRTPAPSRAWRARQPHLPRDFPACRCAAKGFWRASLPSVRTRLAPLPCSSAEPRVWDAWVRVDARKRRFRGGSPYEEQHPKGWRGIVFVKTDRSCPAKTSRRRVALFTPRAPTTDAMAKLLSWDQDVTTVYALHRPEGHQGLQGEDAASTLCWSSSCRRTPP